MQNLYCTEDNAVWEIIPADRIVDLYRRGRRGGGNSSSGSSVVGCEWRWMYFLIGLLIEYNPKRKVMVRVMQRKREETVKDENGTSQDLYIRNGELWAAPKRSGYCMGTSDKWYQQAFLLDCGFYSYRPSSGSSWTVAGIDFIGYIYLMCDKCRLTEEWSWTQKDERFVVVVVNEFWDLLFESLWLWISVCLIWGLTVGYYWGWK